MLVICVIAAVIGSFVYTVIKLKIEEWLKESRMSRLSLKKRHLRNEESQPGVPGRLDVIEISNDESDDSKHCEPVDTDDKAICMSPSKKQYDEETLLKFQKSTDSLNSDENEEEPVFQSTSNLKPKTSMFGWNQKYSKANRDIKTVDSSDDSDDLHQNSARSRTKQGRKILKTFNEDTPPIESKVKEEAPAEVAIQFERMISGVKVKIPVKPYPCQVAVMNKLIQGCVKKENCLLESPTGSGKTLALLCGVLAWHDHYTAQIQKEFQANQGDFDSPDGTKSDAGCSSNCYNDLDRKCIPEEEDFETMFNNATAKRPRIPKIFYGTRTHKQIEQVVRELKTTDYKHKKMTILSSREHSCIQESTKNKTELCNELLDPTKHKGCPFYNEGNKRALSSFALAESRGLNAIWDIEDLVAIGREEGLCPYYGARNLMEHADIIFCPYNYIIDPDIRDSMQLDLKNQVIILDEAHNIEDICRNVASVSFREDHLKAAATECEALAKQRASDLETYNTIKVYLLKLMDFLKVIGVNKIDPKSDDLSSPYWTGGELLELFNMHKLGEPTYYKSFLVASNAAIADSNQSKEDNRLFPQKSAKPVITPVTQRLIEHLMFAMQMITSVNFVNDYRACVVEATVKDFKYATDDSWYSARKHEHRARTLKLICMNPAVIFSPLAQSSRSIILASGTLTPTASFQSELNTAFVHVLNTAHVIPKEQVYATCVPRGPNRVQLKANYENVNSWSFQDELGQVLLDICESVPHGILCFFSSYNVMNTQIDRWRNNSTWSKITSIKQVFIEPRYGGDLTAIMNEYREVIQDTSVGPRGKVNGALFLAVFRGKVAEGIDFRDNEARCVVTVGIPYAVRKDPVIDMKLKYNDMNTSRGLLRGSDWYSIQAFRALNQALGRCLRHINDWGAVLLVDERFLLPGNKENLPKWVKTMWISHNGYDLKEGLRTFVTRQKARDRKE